jgi:hypothetical protein
MGLILLAKIQPASRAEPLARALAIATRLEDRELLARIERVTRDAG